MKRILQRDFLTHTPAIVTVLLVSQPVLDVLSYFMGEAELTSVTTALRCLLLVAVSAYGFYLSDRKWVYGAMYGAIGALWLLHGLNCARMGYMDPIGDVAEYLKLIQLPLWTLSFITCLKKSGELFSRIPFFFAVNFTTVLLIILLSYAVGAPAYTYDFSERGIQLGVLGWFGVPNAQSAILCLLVTGLLLWAARTERLSVFSLACALGMGLLYLTGTRLTYFSAVLLCGAFGILFLLTRRHIRFCIPLLLTAAVLLTLQGVSPMVQRQKLTANSYAIYEEKAAAVLGEDWDFTYAQGEEIPPEKLEKIQRVYTEVYSKPGVFGGPLLGDLLERFGLEKVMEQYHYATQPQVLYNSRTKRLAALDLIRDEKDFPTRLLGFEYAEATINGYNYDAENDLSALPFYYGYLGAALYLGFILYFVWCILKGLVQNRRRFFDFLSLELGAYSLICILALGAAQFSGQVLRKPNVTVYFSLALAGIYYLVKIREYPGSSLKQERKEL